MRSESRRSMRKLVAPSPICCVCLGDLCNITVVPRMTSCVGVMPYHVRSCAVVDGADHRGFPVCQVCLPVRISSRQPTDRPGSAIVCSLRSAYCFEVSNQYRLVWCGRSPRTHPQTGILGQAEFGTHRCPCWVACCGCTEVLQGFLDARSEPVFTRAYGPYQRHIIMINLQFVEI